MSSNTHIINLPSKMEEILNQNEELGTNLFKSLISFSYILKENKLYFFPEYTDHGINHIESVLESIDNLISDDTLRALSANDVGILLVATVLHDIGMHTSPEMFKNMIDGKYDNIEGNLFKEKTWNTLWQEYLKDCKYWGAEKKKNVLGNENYIFTNPNLDDLQSLNEYDKKLIGEFIRINHPRIAYEIAIKGFIGHITYSIDGEGLPNHFTQIAGLVARSHGMNVRDTFDYLKKLFGRLSWKKPHDIKVVFLMTLIRLADYLQIDSTRINVALLNLKTIYSPYSKKELETHKSIDFIQLDNDDKERIVVQASPQNAEMYVKIERLIQDIQKEFDISWAVLGEVYNNEYKLKYRRIVTNISDDEMKEELPFVPKQFGFKFNADLIKLLIAPLYGNNPSFGVRELVQNAVDACRIRMAIDKEYKKSDTTHVRVNLDSKTKLFTISDTGIGMTLDEIERYFLTIGSSYDCSTDWQKIRDINKTYRTGRFGIGILAAFLIGSKIIIETKSIKEDNGYKFSISLNMGVSQIDKANNIDSGTKISILCFEECFDRFKNDALLRLGYDLNTVRPDDVGDEWFDWYIDSIPTVEYIYDSQPIPISMNAIKGYKILKHNQIHFGNIFWKPIDLISGTKEYARYLYCNGFFITDNSNKTEFSFKDINHYFLFKIPSLIISDLHNSLPLNLQRNNIEKNVEYSFERELVIAVFKDFLSQLLAIDVEKFKHIDYLFLNKSGFTFNKSAQYPMIYGETLYYPEFASELYKEKCLRKKILVHIHSGLHLSCIQLDKWKMLMESYPNAFFTFYDKEGPRLDLDFLERIMTDDKSKFQSYFKDISIALHCDYNDFVDYTAEGIEKDYFDFFDKLAIEAKTHNSMSGDYYIIEDGGQNRVIIDSITSFLSNQAKTEWPLYFIIHHIKEDETVSEFDEFFKEYAGGDTIIPYDEADRRKKFAKIYEECSEDIEKYRRLYADK